MYKEHRKTRERIAALQYRNVPYSLKICAVSFSTRRNIMARSLGAPGARVWTLKPKFGCFVLLIGILPVSEGKTENISQ